MPSEKSAKESPVSWVVVVLVFFVMIYLLVIDWLRAGLTLFLILNIAFVPLRSSVDKAKGTEGNDDCQRGDAGASPSPWPPVVGGIFITIAAFLDINFRIRMIDRREAILPALLVFAVLLLISTPAALKHPRRKQAMLAAGAYALCFALMTISSVNYCLDDGRPVSTEARMIQRDGVKLMLPDGTLVAADGFIWRYKESPAKDDDLVDFMVYQGLLGIRYTTHVQDKSWTGNPIAPAVEWVRSRWG